MEADLHVGLARPVGQADRFSARIVGGFLPHVGPGSVRALGGHIHLGHLGFEPVEEGLEIQLGSGQPGEVERRGDELGVHQHELAVQVVIREGVAAGAAGQVAGRASLPGRAGQLVPVGTHQPVARQARLEVLTENRLQQGRDRQGHGSAHHRPGRGIFDNQRAGIDPGAQEVSLVIQGHLQDGALPRRQRSARGGQVGPGHGQLGRPHQRVQRGVGEGVAEGGGGKGAALHAGRGKPGFGQHAQGDGRQGEVLLRGDIQQHLHAHRRRGFKVHRAGGQRHQAGGQGQGEKPVAHGGRGIAQRAGHQGSLHRLAGHRVGHHPAHHPALGRAQAEGPDAGVPGYRRRRRVVLVHIPEGDIIHRIHGQHGVVAPARRRAGLRAAARIQDGLALEQAARGISGEAARVVDGGIDAGRGTGVADGQVALPVQGGAAHPAVGRIGGEGGLVDDGEGAGRDVAPEVVVANARVIDVRIHRVRGHQRFVAAEVAVLHPVHQAVRDGIQLLRRAGLRDVVAVAREDGVKGGHGIGVVGPAAEAERAQGRVGPVDLELPQVHGVKPVDRAVIHHGEIAGRAFGRRRAIQIGRQHAAVVGVHPVQIEVLVGGVGVAGQHLRAVEDEHPRPAPVVAVELVVGHVVAIRPDPEVRVVVHLRVGHDEVIEVPRPGGVGGLGDGDDLVAGGHADDELADHPAVGQVIVEHDGVAVVGGGGGRGEAGRRVQAAHQERGHQVGPRHLVVDAHAQVDHLHIVVQADVTVAVGRVDAIQIADSLEGQQRLRHGGRRDQALHHGVRDLQALEARRGAPGQPAEGLLADGARGQGAGRTARPWRRELTDGRRERHPGSLHHLRPLADGFSTRRSR